MNGKKYYLVVMQRWGDPKGHSYTLCLETNPVAARICGINNHYYRGGKYDPKVIEVDLMPQTKYWLVEQYDGDREYLKVRLCHSKERAETAKREKTREKAEITEIKPGKELSKEDVLSAHEHIQFFNTEEQEFLRHAYENIIRSEITQKAEQEK